MPKLLKSITENRVNEAELRLIPLPRCRVLLLGKMIWWQLTINIKIVKKVVCIPVGCVPPACWRIPGIGSASRGVCLGGVCILGVCIQGVCPTPQVCLQGVCPTLPQGLPTGWGRGLGQTPSPVDRMTHRCKNITLPQTSFAGGKLFFGAWRLESGIDRNYILCRQFLSYT